MESVQHAKDSAEVDLGCLLDAGDGAVVTLVAGDTRLAAHRAVLSDRSPVFGAMFRHDTLEANSGQVDIADVEGPVLRLLVSYLYTLRAPQLPEAADQLLAAADKYGVSGLKAACEQQLAARLSVETAVAAAVTAIRHSCAMLRQAAVAYIKAHLDEAMATRGWADAVTAWPKEFIELSQLLSQTSAPPPAASGTSASPRAASQPHSGHTGDSRHSRHTGDSRHSRTPASAAPDTAASRHTAPPDNATVPRLRSLPAEERSRRLREAAKQGALGELEALLAAGADVAAGDGTRRTALHYAALEGHVEAARLLVARGAEVAARDCAQWTPLHMAAVSGQAAVVRLLLAASADHGARDCAGWTPLHTAAVSGHREAAAALLEAGADRAARDNMGQTPLDLARRGNHQQLVELLTRT